MRGLGLTQRWKGRPGAVERAAKALARRGGVAAANYITHIMDGATGKTMCGRRVSSVNCQGDSEQKSEATCVLCASAARIEGAWQSPMNRRQWQMRLSCGHEEWRAVSRRPRTGMLTKCSRCAADHRSAVAPETT